MPFVLSRLEGGETVGIRKGEDIEAYRQRQYAEDDKTVRRILECLDGLTLEDVIINAGLGNIAAEQRRAEESLARITERMERSEESANRIESSVARSESIVGELAVDIERNAGEVDLALERIGDAESGNCDVAERIERSERRISDGLRRAEQSESIFSRYEKEIEANEAAWRKRKPSSKSNGSYGSSRVWLSEGWRLRDDDCRL